MREALQNLLSGRAFRPDPRDTAFPLRVRLERTPFIVAALTGRSLLAQSVRFDRRGFPQAKRLERSPEQVSAEAQTRFLADLGRQTDASHLVLLVDQGWFATLVANAFRGPHSEWERLLREDPRQITLSNPADGIRYAAINHPSMNRSIIFSFRRDIIKQAEELAADAGLTLARLQSGCFTLLSSFLEKNAERAKGCDLLVCDEGSLLLLIEEEGDWVDVGSRGDLDDATLVRALEDLLERRRNPQKPLAWIGRGILGGKESLAEAVRGQFELRELNDTLNLTAGMPCEFSCVLEN